MEQRPVPAMLGSLNLLRYRSLQVDDYSPVSKPLPVRCAGYGASTGGKDNALPASQVIDYRLFPLAKANLAFLFENKRNIHSGTTLDFSIGIDESLAP
jgi:hypothetical protein